METTTSPDGTLIAYTRTNGADQGNPLLLVHGTTDDHTYLEPLLEPLTRHRTVYTVDRRGRGESGDGEGPYELEREFDDIAAVIDDVARSTGSPVDVFGHSYGAICALEAALRTDKVDRLLLYEPPIPLDGPTVATEAIEQLERLLERGEHEQVLVTFYTQVLGIPPSEVDGFRALPDWPNHVATAPTVPRELSAASNYSFRPQRFARLGAPTLLLIGGDSPEFLTEPSRRLHEVLPHSELVEMPGQEHTAIDVAPALLANELLRFLAD